MEHARRLAGLIPVILFASSDSDVLHGRDTAILAKTFTP